MNIAERIRWIVQTAYIHHSASGEFYYITWGNRRPHYWMSVETIDGPVPEEKKHEKLYAWVQINHDDGRVYHRQGRSFAFWKIASAHDEVPIDKKDDLFQDYATFEGWAL